MSISEQVKTILKLKGSIKLSIDSAKIDDPIYRTKLSNSIVGVRAEVDEMVTTYFIQFEYINGVSAYHPLVMNDKKLHIQGVESGGYWAVPKPDPRAPFIGTIGSDSDDLYLTLNREIPKSVLIISMGKLQKRLSLTNEVLRKDESGSGFCYRHKFCNTSLVDILKRLDIHHENSKFGEIHCLIYALKLCELATDHLLSVFSDVLQNRNGKVISRRELPYIANKLGINIVLASYDKSKEIEYRYIHHDSEKILERKDDSRDYVWIGLHKKHFIKYEKDICYKKDLIKFGVPEECVVGLSNKKLTSLQLLRVFSDHAEILRNRDLFVPNRVELNMNLKEIPDGYLDKIDVTDKSMYEPFLPKDHSGFKVLEDWSADSEAYVNGDVHKCFMIKIWDGFHMRTFDGPDVCDEVVKYLLDPTSLQTKKEQNIGQFVRLVKFHNSTYDVSFLLTKLINTATSGNRRISICEKDGKYVTITVSLGKDCSLKLIDSYRLIPERLANFPKMFGLTAEKECIFYNMFDENFLQKGRLHTKKELDEKIKEWNKDRIKIEATPETFYTNMDKWGFKTTDGRYDLWAYCDKYCHQDVMILHKGFEIFRNLFYKQFGLDCNNFVSISSLALEYLIVQGCFDECYKMNGVLGKYCQNCNRGGRVQSAYNKKVHKMMDIMRDWIADVDANALYPTAMSKLDGFVKGKPKIMKSDTDLDKVDYYICRVKFRKVHQEDSGLPFHVVGLEEDGCVNWSLQENKVYYLDKTSIKECLRYYKYLTRDDLEIIDGIYWDESFNEKIKDVMKDIHEKKLQFATEGNKTMVKVLKLFANSCYGKLNEHYHEDEVKYMPKEKFSTYLINQTHRISEFNELDNGIIRVKSIKKITDSYSAPHLSSQILSLSKAIMNDLFIIGKKFNILDQFYYTDTDSLHIDNSAINIIEREFLKMNGYPLLGNDLGQFKSDFEIDGYEGVSVNDELSKELRSKELIVLGKKTYIDVLHNPLDEFVGYHIRCKGVKSDALKVHCKLKDISEVELYRNLLDPNHSEKIELYYGVNQGFKKEKDQLFHTVGSLERTIQFP